MFVCAICTAGTAALTAPPCDTCSSLSLPWPAAELVRSLLAPQSSGEASRPRTGENRGAGHTSAIRRDWDSKAGCISRTTSCGTGRSQVCIARTETGRRDSSSVCSFRPTRRCRTGSRQMTAGCTGRTIGRRSVGGRRRVEGMRAAAHTRCRTGGCWSDGCKTGGDTSHTSCCDTRI
jgi:hypothetical protein